MYVCICSAVTDKEIQQAIDTGARTIKELQQKLDICTCCGQCAELLQQMVNTSTH